MHGESDVEHCKPYENRIRIFLKNCFKYDREYKEIVDVWDNKFGM